MMDSITVALLDYNDAEMRRWRAWFHDHPEALQLPCDIADAETVEMLVKHLSSVVVFFAQKLRGDSGEEASRNLLYENLARHSADELMQQAQQGHQTVREFLESADEESLLTTLSFGSGERKFTASRRKMTVQVLVHEIRHWAQLATLLRQQGFKTWNHDPLMVVELG